MRAEWAADRGAAAGALHKARCFDAFRAVRKVLDDFAPDFVVIWGDDQYENFKEEIIPPFCVFAAPEIVCRPFARMTAYNQPENHWHEPADTTADDTTVVPAASFVYRSLPSARRKIEKIAPAPEVRKRSSPALPAV